MSLYSCKLGASDGKIILRDFEAADGEVLRKNLEDQGFFVFAVKKKPFQFLFDKGLKRRKIDNRALLTFNQEMLVLIKAGMPIMQVLDAILERHDSGPLYEVLVQVREDVKAGAALSIAMEKHGRAFPYLYVASIRAGERTGDLPQTIRRYIEYLKRVGTLRKKIVAAVFYPAILIVFAFLAITLLLVYVVPTFVGLGTPYWDSEVRGAVFGITRGTTKEHVIRATLKAIAFQVKDVLTAMEEDAGIKLKRLKVDGGAVQNNFLMQFQSDILQVPLDRPVVTETTALGAAYLAGLAVGFWATKEEIAAQWLVDTSFKPELPQETINRLYHGWKMAVKAAIAFKP